MKIRIKNLGAIHEASLEIKPFTVFIGPNNTGKTQSAYVIGGLLGKWGVQHYTNAYVNNQLTESYPLLENSFEKFLKTGNAKINFNTFLNRHGEEYFTNLAKFSPNWVQNFFATKKMNFDNFRITFEDWEELHKNLKKNYLKTKIEAKLSVTETGQALITIVKEIHDYNFFIVSHENINQAELPKGELKRLFFATYFTGIHAAIHPGVFFFPAERTGFISFLLPLERRKTIEPESGTSGKVLPTPIADMFETIVNIYFHGDLQKRKKAAINQKDIKKYLELSEILQNEIIGGVIDFSTPDINLPRDLVVKWQSNEDIILDMPVLSSAVKDLTPLALFLSYTARQNYLIIIDEPEMNLHPKAQAQLIEFLAIMVNSGLNILITTHSPYIVDHLVNLIKAEKFEQKEKLKDKFFLHRTSAFISQDKVAVYLFGDNTSANILNNDGSIDWDTFSSITDEIMQISLDL